MKPRVLHVIDHTGSGGAQVVVRHILRALKNEFSFAVAVLGYSGEFSDAYRALGIPVYALGNRGSRWNPLSVVGLLNIIHREEIDLIHTHLLKANVLGTIAAKWTGARTILHDHSGTHPQTLKYHFSHRFIRHSYIYAFRYALSQCDRVLVLTPEDIRSYLAFYSVDPRKIAVLPNGIDLNEFDSHAKRQAGQSLRQELGLSAETRLVVMVGRLDPKKDWLTFLQVAEQVQQRLDHPCGFLVVGSGPEERNLRDYARTHKLEQIFFLGHRDDVPWLLQEADVFLLTSRCEAFGIVLLEAMAAGCPIVATRSGGPESILTDGVDGLLAEVGDVQGLTNRVMRLLDDRALSQRLARSARQTVVNRYSLEAVSTRLADIYEEVLEQRVI